MSPVKNEVAVMFSGGIDSLLASVLLQQKYDKVHLITFDKGYLEFGVKNNQPNVDRLKATYGADRITHEVVDLKDVVKRIAVKKIFKDRKKYNMETRWCVGCRMGMNTGGLLYALEHDLIGYADGSNREQVPSDANLTGTAENYPSIVNRHKNFAMDYAVHFITPTYEYGTPRGAPDQAQGARVRHRLPQPGHHQEDLGPDDQRGPEAQPAHVLLGLDHPLEAQPPRQARRAERSHDRGLHHPEAGRGRPRGHPRLLQGEGP